MREGDPATRRLPFHFQAHGGAGRLVLTDATVGPVAIDKLELEITDVGTDPGGGVARFQRRRTQLRGLAIRITQPAIDDRTAEIARPLAQVGISQLSARLDDGYISVRARAADGLAAADLSFRVELVNDAAQLRALASAIRVHGHLPTPGPVIADRLLRAVLGAGELAPVSPGSGPIATIATAPAAPVAPAGPSQSDRPLARGLADVDVDLVGVLLWHLLPPSGWRLPAVADIELTHIRIARSAIEIAYGPTGTRTGELGVRLTTRQLAAAHDLMHAVDHQLRGGALDDAMRGYRALLASGGPDQPILLGRILALAAARPAWFVDGLELARQALGRWPGFAPAHAALASITLAQGDARDAARHLETLARIASGDGDDDQAALAALAAARLLRVTDARAATGLYQLALEHDPGAAEAADSLADRFADEQRWPELVRLVRSRAAAPTGLTGLTSPADAARSGQLHLRLAGVFLHQLHDLDAARAELAAARQLIPDDPAVHELTASAVAASDPAAAIAAWREVARLADRRGDHRTCARAWARLGELYARPEAGTDDVAAATADSGALAEDAWRRALELDPLQADALVGLATAAAARGDHDVAADLYERLRGLGLGQADAARQELALARSLVALGRHDDARASLRRAMQVGGETTAEAHAVLAEVAEAGRDRVHAAAELDTAIAALLALAGDRSSPPSAGDAADAARRITRAAELATERAALLDRARPSGHPAAATDWLRAHRLAGEAAAAASGARTAATTDATASSASSGSAIAAATIAARANALTRRAARALLARAEQTGHAAQAREWADAALATDPPALERAELLVRRAAAGRPRSPGASDVVDASASATGDAPADVGSATGPARDTAALADVRAALALLDGSPTGDAEIRHLAHQLEAELLARRGDLPARAEALAAIAGLDDIAAPAARAAAAATAWLAADDPAAALPLAARARSLLAPGDTAELRRQVLVVLGEAAWRQRAWTDAVAAYRALVDDPGEPAGDEPGELLTGPTARYRLAVAAERTGDPAAALAALHPLVDDPAGMRDADPTLRTEILRLFADLAERASELPAAAAALETLAALGDIDPRTDGSATARADALYRAGELFRRADRGDDAIRCLDAALRIADAHLPALDALETAWRERGDLERVAAILGRKVAATARHPARQKPLLSRLGDLQDQLGRPDLALATHQRALEIDPTWRPSLRYVTLGLRDAGQVVAAATGLAQLVGELQGDQGLDLAVVTRERQLAAEALSALVARLDDAQLDAVRTTARPALERAALDNAAVGSGLARLRGEPTAPSAPFGPEPTSDETISGRPATAASNARALRDAAARDRAAGKLAEAFATLETANHILPGNPDALRELVELAGELADYPAAARHLAALANRLTGARRGDALLELADLHYDKLDDIAAARDTMRRAADAFGSGTRRDATLRIIAAESATHLAWDIAVDALTAIAPDKRTQADFTSLATALTRAGRDADALAAIETATAEHRFDDGGELVRQLQHDIQRKTKLARTLEDRAAAAPRDEAVALRDEIDHLRVAIGQPSDQPLHDVAAQTPPAEPGSPDAHAAPAEPVAPAAPAADAPRTDTAPWPARTKTKPGLPSRGVSPAPASARRQPTRPPPLPSAPSDEAAADFASPPSTASAPSIAIPDAQELDEPSSGIPIAAVDSPLTGDTPIANPDGLVDSGASITNADGLVSSGAPIAADDSVPSSGIPIAAVDGPPSAPINGSAILAAASTALFTDELSFAAPSAATAGDSATTTADPAAAATATSHPVAGDSTAAPATADSDVVVDSEPATAHDSAESSSQPASTEAAASTSDAAVDPSTAAADAATAEPTTSDDAAAAAQALFAATPASPIVSIVSSDPSRPVIARAHTKTANLRIPAVGDSDEPAAPPPTRRPRTPTAELLAQALDPHGVDDRESPAAPPARAHSKTANLRVPSIGAPARSVTIPGTPLGAPPPTDTIPGTPARPEPRARRPSEPDPDDPRRRRSFSSPAIGRIKLIPGAVTRPGLGSLRDEPDQLDDPDDSGAWRSVSNPALTSSRTTGALPPIPELSVHHAAPAIPLPPADDELAGASDDDLSVPSVTITGTPEETALALMLAAASANRDQLIAAHRADPDDPSLLLAVLAHLGDREPQLRRELLEQTVRTGHGRAQAIALHELATLARDSRDPIRAAALWTRAHAIDPSYPPVWMPLADALAAADDTEAARELYDAVAHSSDYDASRRAFAADRAQALGRDDSIISGEIKARPLTDLEEARQLAEAEDWPSAIDAVERAAAARPNDPAVLEVLEKIYLGSGNVTAASEAIGRQLQHTDDPAHRAALWRRRARMYRDAIGRDAEAYRCLKEAHEASPADPEVAYQLRTAAMVRGDWSLAAQLLYREIAAAGSPRDRGALHLELALVYEERLDDHGQAQANYEQALAFDPTIPAVKLPLARRYEAIGRSSDAAKLYEEAAATARAADRAGLLDAAARCRQAAAEAAEPDLAAQLDRAEAAGDLDSALDLAHQLWRSEPGHAAAFRVLANVQRNAGDLAALTELTRARARRADSPEERATAWLEVARLAEEIGAQDQAARAYDLALIEDPGHTSALDARGALAFRLADFATADLIYRDLGTGESVLGDDELALRRSIIAEQLGRDSEALQLAQIARSLAPGRRDVAARVQELATRIGELFVAMAAARHVLELIPLDDDEGQLAILLALVELLRQAGQLDEAVVQLERILRDHPVHANAIEALAQVHAARGDWPAATRYLYQLVPLAPSPVHRADRLYQLGEAVLVHLDDVDRADDAFLRASDLDPSHVPTLRRLLDVYWRSDDPGGIVEVASELAERDALLGGPGGELSLAHAMVAAALVGDTQLAHRLQIALGDAAPRQVAAALAELAGRTGRLQLSSASIAVAELARRGVLDLAKLRAATAGTLAANSL